MSDLCLIVSWCTSASWSILVSDAPVSRGYICLAQNLLMVSTVFNMKSSFEGPGRWCFALLCSGYEISIACMTGKHLHLHL